MCDRIHDRLDPRLANSPLERARLLNLAPAWLVRCRSAAVAIVLDLERYLPLRGDGAA